MIRGNHECQSISQIYGFKKEILRNYDENVYLSFIESFEYLPYAAVLNDSIFCVHGGIGPTTSLKKINVVCEPCYLCLLKTKNIVCETCYLCLLKQLNIECDYLRSFEHKLNS